MYAVWYSMGLTGRQDELLRGTIRRLAALRSAEEVAQAIPFVRVTDATWASVLDVLALWGGWAPTWEERQALWDGMPDMWRSRGEHVQSGNLMRSFLEVSTVVGCKARDLEEEFTEYRKSLIVQPPGTPATRQSAPCVNVTLFTQKDRYTLHYATSHVTGYGLYEYSGSESLSAYCFGQFKGWLAAARSRMTTCPSSVVWELEASDCLTWCQKLMPCRPRYYDSVNTSNLANYVGLLPLLTNVRPLVRPTAFVEILNLLDINGESAVDFLQMELKLPSVLWPSVLGWRCIGMEPQGMQTEYGNGQWDTIPSVALLQAAGPQRKETKYLWVPAPLLPGKCFDLEESPLVEGSFAEMLQGTAAVGLTQVHTITTTALPVMLRLMTASQAKTALADASRRSVSFCEAEDLALLMLGERRPSEYEAITVPWQPEWTEGDELNQPVLTASVVGRASEMGNVVSLMGIAPRMYNGIWRTANSVGTVTKDVHWVMARGKRELPGGSLNTRTSKMLTMVDMSTQQSRVLTAPPLGVPQMLLKEGEVLPDDGASIARWWINSDGDVSIEVALSDAWMAALNAGETLSLSSCVSEVLWEDEPSSRPAHYGVELRCRKTKAAASRTQFFATPTPVSEAGSRLLLSRKRRCVTLVLPLAPYPPHHQVRSGLRVGGAIGTRRPPSKDALVVVSGMQLSKSDKAAANESTGNGVHSEPPLVGMKKSIAAFLQTTEKCYMFATKAQGNCVLAFRHGLQVDSASGVVYADFSICFLERSFVQDVVQKWLAYTDDDKTRTVLLADDELPLLRQYFEMHARRLKGAKPHKEVPAWAHKHFTHVLLPPLMLPCDAMQPEFRASMNFEGEDLKRRGNAYAKDKHFALALATYKQVLPLAKGPHDTKLAVACLSNIAHCNVQIGTRAAAKDARASAEKGLSLLKGSTEAWVASLEYKLHYRIALACERTGDMPDARDAIHRALAAKGGKDDPAIRAAASRIEAASYSADVD